MLESLTSCIVTITASVQSKIAFRNNVIICVQSAIEKDYSNDAQVVRGMAPGLPSPWCSSDLGGAYRATSRAVPSLDRGGSGIAKSFERNGICISIELPIEKNNINQ
jgi:hypothetical protein